MYMYLIILTLFTYCTFKVYCVRSTVFDFHCLGGCESEEQSADGGTDYTLARHGSVAHALDGRGGNCVPLPYQPRRNLPI